MSAFLDQFKQYRKYQVTLIYPEDRTITGDILMGWLSDAVANGECSEMPTDWNEALDRAEECLDITFYGPSVQKYRQQASPIN